MMVSNRSSRTRLYAAALLVTAMSPAGLQAAGPRDLPVPSAERGAIFRLDVPRRLAIDDTSLTCFEGPLTGIINPGCFTPPTSGNCTSTSSQFFVQDIVPDFATPRRIAGFGFISNDGATVYPSAGVVLVPFSENRFPTAAELAALQVHNVPTPHDTAIVVVDLRPFNLLVTSNTDVFVCLQFPAGGQITGLGNGPGILVDEVQPDPNCDFLTADAGASYFRPAVSRPTDFGFEALFDTPTAIAPASWSSVKRLYGEPRVFPYKSP
jgi:hypothetical protein